MRRLFVLSCHSLVLLAQAGNTGAPPSTRVSRDIEFASRLKSEYVDLAEDFVTKLEANPALSDTEKAQVSLVRSDIISRKAVFETDVKKKIATLQQSVTVIEEFLKKYPNHPSTSEAQSRVGELSREMGDAIVDAMGEEKDSKKLDELRNEGDKRFKDAEQFFRKQSSREPNANPDQAVDVELATAKLNLYKTQYRHSLLYEGNHPQRSFLLKESLKGLDEFLFDFGVEGFGGTYEGHITKGLVYKELKDWPHAKDAFLQAINIKDLYEDPDNPGSYQWDDLAPGVIARAYGELCRAGNHFQDYMTVIDAADNCFKLLPGDLKNVDLGWIILLEKAKAYAATGQFDAGQKTVDTVIKNNPGGPYARQARQLIADWMAEITDASPQQLLSGARAEFTKGSFDRGMDLLRRAVRKGIQTPETQKFAAEAYYLMGRFLDGANRDDEAVLAYLQVAEVDAKYDNAPDALYRAATNLTQLSGSPTGGSYYDGLYQKTVRLLTEKYPNSKEAKSAELFQARQLEGKKKWEEAAKIYDAVPESNSNYSLALNRAAWCHFNVATNLVRLAKPDLAKDAFDKAEKAYRKALNYSNTKLQTAKDEAQLADFKAFSLVSVTQIAEIYLNDAVKKPAEALKLLEGLEKTYAEPESQVRILHLRLQALTDLGKLDEASTALDNLLAKAPADMRGLSSSCRDLAARLEKDAEDRGANSKSGLDPKALSNLRKATRYYQQWIERGRTNRELRQGVNDVITAADRLDAIGIKANGLTEANTTILDVTQTIFPDVEYWKQAAGLYESLLKSPWKESLGANIWTVRLKLGRCLAILATKDGGNWARAMEAFETLIKAENVVNQMNGALNASVLAQKPTLLNAYAGLGITGFMVGKEKKDNKLLADSGSIFARIREATEDTKKIWWFARYMTVEALYEQGEYQSAKTVIDSIMNNYPKWEEGKFGLDKKFDNLKLKVDQRAPGSPK